MIFRKPYNEFEYQVLIDTFNRYGQDSIVAHKLYRKLKRTEKALINQLGILRREGKIGPSAASKRNKKAAETRTAITTTVNKVEPDPQIVEKMIAAFKRNEGDDLYIIAERMINQLEERQLKKMYNYIVSKIV
jgi:F0F1-type ATP synthase gamma subunit